MALIIAQALKNKETNGLSPNSENKNQAESMSPDLRPDSKESGAIQVLQNSNELPPAPGMNCNYLIKHVFHCIRIEV